MRKHLIGAVGILLLLVAALFAEIGPMPTCPPTGPNGSYPRCGGHPCGCAPTH